MEMNVEKINYGNENPKATIPSADGMSKTTGECGIFPLFG
jgi:hypothetical protein